ncbi:hypothetical protein QBC47DRAFT_395703 [Echria macrotheca]|uniref:CENP-V/GFA domain-containing protein n=1 Tax=Echria macrotheca TaxID=438768 RepID=A0AAJ0B0L3_9PEZI|nr:hypothetical protein QBC47DRAFT_395703 [Echria macrotheca]
MTDSDTTPQRRRPYTGSCHCGFVKYIIYLTVPPSPPPPSSRRDPNNNGRLRQHVYRCNCTTCHKLGLLHIRLPSPPDDFLLLSPLDPLRELGDYQCFQKKLHFLFCRTCGARCFTFAGEGEVVEREVPLSTDDARDGEKKTVWCPKQGWVEDGTRYLSVNGYTVDAGQEGLDWRVWTENKWVMYMDWLSGEDAHPVGEDRRRYDRPFPGGAY